MVVGGSWAQQPASDEHPHPTPHAPRARLNNNRINTVDALWSKTPHTVSEEEHNQFYRFVAGAWDSPRFTLHYQVCPTSSPPLTPSPSPS